jgi:hypothetical protein
VLSKEGSTCLRFKKENLYSAGKSRIILYHVRNRKQGKPFALNLMNKSVGSLKTMEHYRTLGLSTENLSLLERLVVAQVRFLLIGGAAVRVYAGSTRKAKDLDLLIDPEIDNATLLHRLLQDCGVTTNFGVEELTKPKKRITLKVWYPYNADLITPSADCSFRVAFTRAKVVSIAGQQVRVMSLSDLITMKSKTGRKRDTRDLTLLRNVRLRLAPNPTAPEAHTA